MSIFEANLSKEKRIVSQGSSYVFECNLSEENFEISLEELEEAIAEAKKDLEDNAAVPLIKNSFSFHLNKEGAYLKAKRYETDLEVQNRIKRAKQDIKDWEGQQEKWKKIAEAAELEQFLKLKEKYKDRL